MVKLVYNRKPVQILKGRVAMEKSKRSGSYAYMAFAAIGMLMLAFGILEYMSLLGNVNTKSFLLTSIGFIILVHYIYYLEKKSGISDKVIWIRSGLLIMSLLALTIFFL